MTPEKILEIVLEESGLPFDEIIKPAKTALNGAVNAKHVAVLLMTTVEGYSCSTVGRALKIGQPNVFYALERAEAKLNAPKWSPDYDAEFKELYLTSARRMEDEDEDEYPDFKPTFWIDDETILATVALGTGITVKEIKSHSRFTEVSDARNLAIDFIIRFNPKKGLKEIGDIFGRHHSTIVFSKRRIKIKLDGNPAFIDQHQAIVQLFMEMERKTA